jgi:hypothetical protein
MAYSRATLVQRIRHNLNPQDDYYEPNTDNVGAGDLTVDVPDGTKWTFGDILEWQEDGDQAFVRSVAGNVLTVFRNWNGTTAAAHDGSVTAKIVAKSPTFQYVKIIEAITEAIDELWPYVYTSTTVAITPSLTEKYYSAAATVEGISSAIQLDTNVPDKPVTYGGRRSIYQISLVRGLPNNFPQPAENTGKAYYIPRRHNIVNTINVKAIRRITDTVTPPNYDDLSAGVEISAVMYFAIDHLLAASDIPRLTGQDTNMSDQSVGAGRRSQISENVWRRKGLRARYQWEEDLRHSLPILPERQAQVK